MSFFVRDIFLKFHEKRPVLFSFFFLIFNLFILSCLKTLFYFFTNEINKNEERTGKNDEEQSAAFSDSFHRENHGPLGTQSHLTPTKDNLFDSLTTTHQLIPSDFNPFLSFHDKISGIDDFIFRDLNFPDSNFDNQKREKTKTSTTQQYASPWDRLKAFCWEKTNGAASQVFRDPNQTEKGNTNVNGGDEDRLRNRRDPSQKKVGNANKYQNERTNECEDDDKNGLLKRDEMFSNVKVSNLSQQKLSDQTVSTSSFSSSSSSSSPSPIQKLLFQPTGRISSESVGEKESRQFLEFLFGRAFPKSRPSFLSNSVLNNGRNLEIDCFNPFLRIGLEYHGKQHYEFVPYFHQNKLAFQNQQYRDYLKKNICQTNKILLIEVPFSEKCIKKFILNFLCRKARSNVKMFCRDK